MEKIQSAIAKARATRDELRESEPQGAGEWPGAVGQPDASQGQGGQTQGGRPAHLMRGTVAPSAQPGPAPVLDPAEDAATAAAQAAAWEALPPFEPSRRVLERNRIVAATGETGSTEIDMLRTRLLQQLATNGWRRVAITSPQPGCGKSTLAANLAFSLARHDDHRTVLCEMDFRHPSLSKMLGMSVRHDLGRVMSGQARFEDNAVRYRNRLAISTAQHGLRNTAELLQNVRTASILEEIEAQYDPTVMLFDLPPMLAGDDAMAFMGRVDAVVLVAAAETTTISQIDSCERELASQTRVMGVVLNKCRYMETPDYGY